MVDNSKQLEVAENAIETYLVGRMSTAKLEEILSKGLPGDGGLAEHCGECGGAICAFPNDPGDVGWLQVLGGGDGCATV